YVEAIGSLTERYIQAGFGVLSQTLRLAAKLTFLTSHRERTRVAAFRVVGAADKTAGLADSQPQAAGAAGRASARILIRIIRIWREEVRPQLLVQSIDDLCNAQAFCLIHRLGEGVPEAA